MKDKSHLRQYASYTSLSVLSKISISIYIYILVDTFFISHVLGADGLAALNLAVPIFSFINGISLMLGMGGATKYSIFKSRRQEKESNIVFTNTIYLAIFFSIIFNGILNCFVRNDGNPRLAMIAMATGSILNIVLDYIFMYPFKMGMFGAVLATCLSPIISMIVLLKYKIKKENNLHIIKTKLQSRMTWDTLFIGFPSLIGELASGVVMIVFNMIILNLMGNIGVAAYGVVSSISAIVISIYNGIAQGVQPLVSREYGRKNKPNVIRFFRYSMITILIVSATIYLIIYNFADSITLIFNNELNMQLQEIATSGLKIYFIALFFLSFNIVISVFFTSIEKALPAFVISLLRGFLIIVPMAFLLSEIAGMSGAWQLYLVAN